MSLHSDAVYGTYAIMLKSLVFLRRLSATDERASLRFLLAFPYRRYELDELEP